MATSSAIPLAPAQAPRDRGLLRRAALAVGLFALVVTGVHAGADQADDFVFELLSLIDRAVDGALARVIPVVMGWFGAEPLAVERAVLRALEWVDLDEKLAASRVVALVIELLVGLALAVPLVDPRAPRASRVALGRALRDLVRDPTVLLWVGPLATGAASLAGLAVVASEIEGLARGALGPLALAPAAEALTARALAIGVTSIVLVVLAARGVLRALVRADALSLADAQRARPALRRRLRGWLVALVALPLALLAASAALPSLGGLAAPFTAPAASSPPTLEHLEPRGSP